MLTCWLRSERIPVTSAALFRRSASDSLRPLMVCDSCVRPSKAGPSWGAIASMVSDSASSDWFSAPVSVAAVLPVKSLTASVREYGEDVWVNGMVSAECRVPARPVPG